MGSRPGGRKTLRPPARKPRAVEGGFPSIDPGGSLEIDGQHIVKKLILDVEKGVGVTHVCKRHAKPSRGFEVVDEEANKNRQTLIEELYRRLKATS